MYFWAGYFQFDCTMVTSSIWVKVTEAMNTFGHAFIHNGGINCDRDGSENGITKEISTEVLKRYLFEGRMKNIHC